MSATVQGELKATYGPLVEGCDAFGSAAVFPWDERIFGFPVGGYRVGDVTFIASHFDQFRSALGNWADRGRVELLAYNVPAEERMAQHLLMRAGFRVVDTALGVCLSAAGLRRLPQPSFRVRLAEEADREAVTRIAQSGFDVGRYHADARFPRELADLRYRRWVENAFAARGGADRIYVLEAEGQVLAFMHVVCGDDSADLRLAAVEPAARGANVGYGLYVGVLDALRQQQIRRVRSKISAVNVAVMNLYAAMGFRFDTPEIVFHWHWPRATHLKDPDALIGPTAQR